MHSQNDTLEVVNNHDLIDFQSCILNVIPYGISQCSWESLSIKLLF